MDVRSMRRVVGAGAVLLLLVPSVARATTPPVITVAPAITGVPGVGAELAAGATWTGDPKPTALWTWLRCATPAGACKAIDEATTDRYRVAEADLGLVLRARVKVTNSAGSVEARSKPTAVIVAAPEPTPTPTPTPELPVVESTPAPVALPAATPPPPAALRPMTPFPVIRIKGLLTGSGARVTLLSVRAPRGARIEVTCKGVDCPSRRFRASAAGVKRLHRFERALRAGTRLEVRVTRDGYIGKYTEFAIRRGAEPKRVDRCLDPGATRPVKCASG